MEDLYNGGPLAVCMMMSMGSGGNEVAVMHIDHDICHLVLY